MAKNKLILEYLQNNYSDGDIIGSFDGGNDSGWVEINTEKFQDEIRKLVDDELNYGSWAGNFEASGTIIFKDNLIQIEGDEIDYEDRIDVVSFEKTLNLPKGVDLVEIETDIDTININASVFNGFVPNETLIQVENDLEKDIEKWIEDNNVDDLENFYNWTRVTNGSTLQLEAGNYTRQAIDYIIDLNL